MGKIVYGLADTLLGQIVLAKSEAGLCWLGFMVEGYKGDGLSRMKMHLQGADLERDDEALTSYAHDVVKAWEEERLGDIPLDLQGTAFQKDVWAALLKIKRGAPKTYGDVANDIGRSKAVRAVGSAVGENPVSLIVPCHRVVPKSGGVGNYGWGPKLKKKLLELESKS